MTNTADKFLAKYNLGASGVDMDRLIEAFHDEMKRGLEGKESSLRMIPTYIEADNEFLTGVPVLAIDAGGTNFRCSLMRFSKEGKLIAGEIMNFRMPGLEEEVSSEEFFRVMAGYVKSLADKTDRVGFCFSYPTEILPTRDGILLQFCKEVKAPGVVGQLIGKNLLEALGTPCKKIVLLNDTVATLLAGKSASFGKSYDSFIGFILGTGTNTCYIEQNRNILKNGNLDKNKSMIINIESGNFGKAVSTELDVAFDNSTMNPGNYSFEKMFSGGYFGGLCLSVLKRAADEGVFSDGATGRLKKLNELTAGEANSFIGNNGESPLFACFTDTADMQGSIMIIDTLIDRAAKLVAANLAAVVLRTGKGREEAHPILITIEGTTFYKLHNLKERFEKYFFSYLDGSRKRYAEFTAVDQSSLIGAGLAALID
jgi:hexokinase